MNMTLEATTSMNVLIPYLQHHPTFCSVGVVPLFARIKQLRYEASHLTPSNAKVKNMWGYAHTPSIHFRVVVHA
jgi:hypothetical protein